MKNFKIASNARLLIGIALTSVLVACGGGGGGGGSSSSGGGASSASATSYSGGPEFLVNTTTDLNQVLPKAITLKDGNVVIIWSTSLGTVGGIALSELRGQIYSPSGAKIGSELIISSGTATSSTSHRHIQHDAIALADGGFAVVYISNGHRSGTSPTSITEGPIFVQAFTSSGAADGPVVVPPITSFIGSSLVSGNGNAFTPKFTSLSNGNILLSWTESGFSSLGDRDNQSIKAQIYNSDGDELSPAFVANTQTVGQQSNQTAIGLNGGGFVLMWIDWNGSNSTTRIAKVRAQIFDATGAKIGSEFAISDKTGINGFTGSLILLDNGNFVASWIENTAIASSTPSTDDQVLAQIYSPSGVKIATEFDIPTITTGRQAGVILQKLSNGRFVASWGDNSSSVGSTTPRFVNKGQIFNADATKFSSEFLISNETTGTQGSPSVAQLAGGSFFATWNDTSGTLGDASGSSIKGRVFRFQ